MWPITESGSRPKKPSLGLSAHAAPLSALRRFCIAHHHHDHDDDDAPQHVSCRATSDRSPMKNEHRCQLGDRCVLSVFCAYHARVEPRRTRTLVNLQPRKFIVHRSTTHARFVTRKKKEEREGENGVSEEKKSDRHR